MKKLTVWLLACLMLLTAPALAEDTSEVPNVTFDIASAYITGVNFTYPVVDLGDAALNEKVNDMIEKDALAPFEGWKEGQTADGGLTVIHREEDILSMSFEVITDTADAMYPINQYYTVNYDLSDCSRLQLKDLIDTQKAAQLLSQAGTLKSSLESVEPETLAAQAEYVAGLGVEEIYAMLENESYQPGMLPSLSQSFVLWGQDETLFIALSVPHALGDWAIFQLSKLDVAL